MLFHADSIHLNHFMVSVESAQLEGEGDLQQVCSMGGNASQIVDYVSFI